MRALGGDLDIGGLRERPRSTMPELINIEQPAEVLQQRDEECARSAATATLAQHNPNLVIVHEDNSPTTATPLSPVSIDVRSASRDRMANIQRADLKWRSREFRRKAPWLKADDLDETNAVKNEIQRICCLVSACRPGALRAKVPQTFEDTIAPNGTIHIDAEVLRFGIWLLVDDKPGLATRPGKKADAMDVFKTVAVAAAELFHRDRMEKASNLDPRLIYRPLGKNITRTHMRNRWLILFDEQRNPTDFKAPLRTAALYLHDYFVHLTNQHTGDDAPVALRSKQLEKVRKAISVQAENQGAKK